ncbi:hypothetical protein DPMN_166677 [Dreissena polymorpha]|uniref:Uncharacterized protein n=1 Tax=Dreissena polymorpha TaxID=45954 RepID=A0A9D4EYE0_DREPO|nr:hypothetical protein DPMN_166677 [Dreissena polymorpha]
MMDREDYVKKLKCEILDSDTYVDVTDDKTRIVENKVKKVTDTLYKKGSIDSDLRRYLTSSVELPVSFRATRSFINLGCLSALL